jgi:membrane protein DedA with SNARE-associated domain
MKRKLLKILAGVLMIASSVVLLFVVYTALPIAIKCLLTFWLGYIIGQSVKLTRK